ncbi:UNVERIFIED_CONTAM: hypothetical protein NCL1_22639 [Trichonephila clavipes]
MPAFRINSAMRSGATWTVRHTTVVAVSPDTVEQQTPDEDDGFSHTSSTSLDFMPLKCLQLSKVSFFSDSSFW